MMRLPDLLRFHVVWIAASIALLISLTPPVFADPITGLNFNVEYQGTALGEIRLHVGTHNFTPTGRDGIGRATPGGEASGFYTSTGFDLDGTSGLAGFDHFNWLQIVTSQPAAHDDPFGLPPHADPSDDPDNQTARDLDPWYLNEVIPTNPPFDLPPGTDTLLPFQDFPYASPWLVDETFGADVFLVGIVDAVERTYTTVASFSWMLTRNVVEGVTRVRMTDLYENPAALSAEYQGVVAAYEQLGWTYVPEPNGLFALLFCAVTVGRRR